MSDVDELPPGAHRQLALTLRDVVPADWVVVGVERDIDEPDAVHVTIKLDDVRRLPQAPSSGRYLVGWTVTIVTPHVDPELADPAVFDALIDLTIALDEFEWLTWSEARKVVSAGRYAYDITLQTITEDPEGEAA